MLKNILSLESSRTLLGKLFKFPWKVRKSTAASRHDWLRAYNSSTFAKLSILISAHIAVRGLLDGSKECLADDVGELLGDVGHHLQFVVAQLHSAVGFCR